DDDQEGKEKKGRGWTLNCGEFLVVSLLRPSLILVQCGQILVHTDAAGVDAMGCGVVELKAGNWGQGGEAYYVVRVERNGERMLTATGWDLVDVTLHWSPERGYSTSQCVL
ncbi:hypothetical protein PspLS_09197, partial [Pyricularia sp. CBS 133598]